MPPRGLEDLLRAYAAVHHVRASAVAPSDVERLEAELGIVLPPDYRRLLCTYDLRDIEVWFSSFSPPSPRRAEMGALEAIRFGRTSDEDPFRAFYREQGVIPVGGDWTQAELVMVVAPGGASTAPRDRTANRLLGSILGYDWEDRGTEFAFVSSTFSQALHTALHLDSVKDELRAGRLGKEAAWEQLLSIDPAIDGNEYWERWVQDMADPS